MRWACWLVVTVALQSARGQLLTGGPNPIVLPEDRYISLYEASGKNIKWRYSGVTPFLNDPPNVIMVVPASGTTPGGPRVGLNPNVLSLMNPGTGYYGLTIHFTTVDQDPPQTVNVNASFKVPSQPPPNIDWVVNTASFQTLLSPGAMVTISGSHLASPTLSATYDDTALYPTTLGNTKATFNGVPVPLLYISPSQINALVPYFQTGETSVEVVVERWGVKSNAVRMPLAATSPGIFTVSQNGIGQAAIRQKDSGGSFSYNSAEQPASPGTAFEVYVTGAGAWNPLPQSDVSLDQVNFSAQPVSLTVGGQPARILYTGTGGGLPSLWGLLQINAVVPEGAGSGARPLVVRIGQNDNAQQNVTMAIR